MPLIAGFRWRPQPRLHLLVGIGRPANHRDGDDRYPTAADAVARGTAKLFRAGQNASSFLKKQIANGRVAIKFIPAKNEHRANPIPIDIMLHPDLAQIIVATKSGHMTFLTTEYGKPFSWLRQQISRVVQSSWITTLFGAWGAKGYCNALG